MKFFTKCLAIFKAWGEGYTILTFQNCLQKQLEENSARLRMHFHYFLS